MQIFIRNIVKIQDFFNLELLSGSRPESKIFNTYNLFLLLAQELIDVSCFTVYLKKEKQPDKDIITYNLTQPVTPFRYNSPSKYYNPKYKKQDNCPSILDIPKIERSNDNEGWTT